MSGRTYSGGGQRQHSGRRRARYAHRGPMVLAMAAGVVYAVTVWEPPQKVDTDDARSALKPRQPDRVTEDATGLHLYSPREPVDRAGTDDLHVRIGWLRMGGREEGLADRVRIPHLTRADTTGVVTRCDQNESTDEVPTSSLHSRGPPLNE